MENDFNDRKVRDRNDDVITNHVALLTSLLVYRFDYSFVQDLFVSFAALKTNGKVTLKIYISLLSYGMVL